MNPEDKKRGVSQSDLYQLYCYANEYHCQHVALIYPKWRKKQEKKESFMFRGCKRKISVISVSLDNIAKKDLFREDLRALFKSVIIS